MHADLSRWTFRPERHYSRVVVQQGRVSLDADANAQASILLYYLRNLAADLIGEFGGPAANEGFQITLPTGGDGKTFNIGVGHYYVDGLLCVAETNTEATTIDYLQQPDGYHQPDGYGALPPLWPSPDTNGFLVWLKVWERFISAVEDPDLREIALGLNAPDTAGRAKLVWQVLASPWPEAAGAPPRTSEGFYDASGPWATAKPLLFAEPRGTLMAQAVTPQASTDVCTLSPSSGYRGPENQLYRVEIHQDGDTSSTTAPTFSFSRDNGSVTAPITQIAGNVVSVTTLGRDPKLSIDVGNYVEIVDDAWASEGTPGPSPRSGEPLHLVTAVDPVALTVTLEPAAAPKVGTHPSLHPYLRRWDQDQVLVTKAGLTIDSVDQAIDIVPGTWIGLEDGIQVQFSEGTYRAGDYWLIPARVITGDVEWPTDDQGNALPLPPEGVRYHVAPLAVFYDIAAQPTDVRRQFTPATCVSLPAAQTSEEPSPAPAPRASRTPRASRSAGKTS